MITRDYVKIKGHINVARHHLTGLSKWSSGDTAMSLSEVKKAVALATQYLDDAVEWLKIVQEEENMEIQKHDS